MISTRTVESRGACLAVYEQGGPGRATVLLVHGYPDTHAVWDQVAHALAADYHVVRYDTRGAGRTGRPGGGRLSDYRLDALAADLFAVAAAVSPDRPVHLAGHDWGSIQSWEAVTEPGAGARVASFTSISGPCLDHLGHWLRGRAGRPTPRRVRELATQAARSWYIAAYQVPVLPGVLLRRFPLKHGSTADAVNGVNLYRANMPSRLARPRERRTDVPVQVITLGRDRYVTPAVAHAADRWVGGVEHRTVAAGHWSALSRHADEVAALIGAFAARHADADPRAGEPPARPRP